MLFIDLWIRFGNLLIEAIVCLIIYFAERCRICYVRLPDRNQSHSSVIFGLGMERRSEKWLEKLWANYSLAAQQNLGLKAIFLKWRRKSCRELKTSEYKMISKQKPGRKKYFSSSKSLAIMSSTPSKIKNNTKKLKKKFTLHSAKIFADYVLNYCLKIYLSLWN